MKNLIKYGAYIGLILMVAGFVQYETGRVWNLFTWLTIISGGICLILYLIVNIEFVRKMFSLRSFRYGGNALAMILIVLAILGVVNFIANRHSYRIDLTAGKQFSLSPQTKNILKNLKKEVRVSAFFQIENQVQTEDLLASYQSQSTKFQYEFIDPDKKPAVAKQYGITAYGTLVLECGGNVEKITERQEQNITNALIKVTREGKKVIYFLSGHGENDMDDKDRTGYNTAEKAIENENYDVQKLILAEKKTIPSDCAVLIISGAQKTLFPSELDTIDSFIQKGGKALFLLDPEPAIGFTDLLSKWGVKVGNDMVLDVSGMGQLFGMGPTVPLVSNYESHRITEKFRLMTFFPYARSVQPVEKKETGFTVQSFIKTSPNSWGETNLSSKEARFDKNQDLSGPVSLGVVVTRENQNRKSRLVVIGDSDFANNSYFGSQGNGDLFMNIISWLAEEEDLVSIRAKNPEDRRVSLTAEQVRWVMIITVILMPLVAIGTGISIYVRQGRK